MNLSKSVKNNPNLYITLKCRGKRKKISEYKKAYGRISNLKIIDEAKYLNIHQDCQNLDYILHYLFFGVKDSIEIKQSYVSPVFNIEFYKNHYSCEDAVLDYVLEGFFKNNHVNLLDDNYITDLDEPIFNQYFKNQNRVVSNKVKDNYYITDKKTLIPYIQSANQYDLDTIRVGVFTNDFFENLEPCPYIRLHALFSELSKSKKYTFFMYGMDSYLLMDIDSVLACKMFDVVVVQRILPFLDELRVKCEKHGIRMIYETDDDLLGVEKNSPSYEYVNEVKDSIINFIDASDTITVTTPNLASKFDSDKTVVIKNYYVESVFDIKKDIKHGGRLKLGYYGTLTHTKDLFLIRNVILKLKEKYDFDFEVIGGFNREDNIDDDWFSSVELPPDNMNFEKFMHWLSLNTDWDIAVVPLEDSSFNQGKSELKYVELSVLAIPGVYSDMCVYNSVIKDGVNGFLASTEDEWISKIEKLILNEDLRLNIYNNALKDVLNNYQISDRIALWDDVLSK